MSGTSLHIGAGRGAPPKVLTSVESPSRNVLVEPDPGFACLLRSKHFGCDSVRVLEVAVQANAPDASHATFYRHNYRLFSGLQRNVDSAQAFSGLRVTDEYSVPVISAESCLQDAGIDQAQNNTLIIELPGGDDAIIEELCGRGKIRCFSSITIQLIGNAPAEVSDRRSRILGALHHHGFELKQTDNSDSMFVTLQFVSVNRAFDQTRSETNSETQIEATGLLQETHQESPALHKKIDHLAGMWEQAVISEQRLSALAEKLDIAERKNLDLDKAHEELARMTNKCEQVEKKLKKLQDEARTFEGTKSKIREEMGRLVSQVQELELRCSTNAHHD